MSQTFKLDDYIRKVPNFPKEGILFYDITSILNQPHAFSYVIDSIQQFYQDKMIDGVAALEARGFYFGSAAALAMQKPFYPIRKAGKLPGEVLVQEYDLEYGSASVEMQVDPSLKGKRILLIDDLIATGGTLNAAVSLLTRQGASVHHLFGVIGLSFLHYRETLKDFHIHTLVDYDKESL